MVRTVEHPSSRKRATRDDGVKLEGSRGAIVAHIGDTFTDVYGTAGSGVWQISGFTGGRIYSPSGFGGTPILRCKLLSGEMPPHWREYQDADGTVEWCGDSVASLLILKTLADGPTGQDGTMPSNGTTP